MTMRQSDTKVKPSCANQIQYVAPLYIDKYDTYLGKGIHIAVFRYYDGMRYCDQRNIPRGDYAQLWRGTHYVAAGNIQVRVDPKDFPGVVISTTV